MDRNSRGPLTRLTALRSIAPRSATARLSWGIADQAVSSITNFALGIVVARSLGAADFGAFSLAWVTYGVLLNLSRGLATDPLTVRYSGPLDDRWRSAARRSASTATALGLVVGALCLLVGLAIGGVVGSAFAALGLTLPGLLLQDSWRIAFFVAGKGQRAFANDVVWGIALVPAMLIASNAPTTFGFVLAWGAAATAAALVGCIQTRMVPRMTAIVSWIREHRDLGPRYLVENVSDSASAQLQMFGLGAIAGLAAVGAVRGAQILLAPVIALRMGISLISVPEAARVLKRWPRRLRAFCLMLGGSQAAACVLFGAGLLLLPPEIGELMLGSIWPLASALIVPTTLAVAAGALFDGAFVGLRALGVSRRSMPVRVARAIAWVVGGIVGGFLGGAAGSVWGTVAANLLGNALVWWQLGVASRESLSRAADSSEAAAASSRDC
jgi:O-antigen/teichoic acid export membrane protein